MEVMVAVQSGTLLHALRVQLKRRVFARRGGDYNEVPQAIQKKSRPSPSNCVFIAESYVFGASAAKINILGPEKKNDLDFFKLFQKKSHPPNDSTIRVPGKKQSFYLENPEEEKLKNSSPSDKR